LSDFVLDIKDHDLENTKINAEQMHGSADEEKPPKNLVENTSSTDQNLYYEKI
jgi:hypothetical protein